MRNVAGVGDAEGLQSWFKGIPLVTKILFCGTLALGALMSFQMVSAGSLLFVWPQIRDKFQIWRLVTPCLFAGPFSTNFAFHVYMIYIYGLRYETNPFNTGGGGTSADVLWMVMLGNLMFAIVSYVFEYPVFSTQLLFMITYVWSRRDPTSIVKILVLQFQAIYLPWVNVAIIMLLGQDIVLPLVGIAVGHLYYFLVHVLPETHGYHLIKTPEFCMKIVSAYTGTPVAPTMGIPPVGRGAAPPAPGAQGAGHAWGRGHVLGAR